MLTHPLLDKLEILGFYGMLKALQEQMQMPDIEKLTFEERLGLLIDREMTARDNRRLKTRLRKAKLVDIRHLHLFFQCLEHTVKSQLLKFIKDGLGQHMSPPFSCSIENRGHLYAK